MVVKIYYKEELFDLIQKSNQFELLKSRERYKRNRNELDKAIQDKIEWTENKLDADLWLLPMNWNYYLEKRIEGEALTFCREAELHSKQIWSSSAGDFDLKLNIPVNVIVYKPCGYKSEMNSHDRIMPFFLTDPIERFFNGDEESVLKTSRVKPIVGFCGKAGSNYSLQLREVAYFLQFNFKSMLGKIPYKLQRVFSYSKLRYKFLATIHKVDAVKTNYLLRNEHRAKNLDRAFTTIEYYNNQLNSDFILCVRGRGNFSIRFYETLAMGRIPIFIDSDTALPSLYNLKWSDFMLVISEKDISRIEEFLNNWIDSNSIRIAKRNCRQLWKENLRLDNFWLNQLGEFNASNHENS